MREKFYVGKKISIVYLCGSIDGVSKEISQGWRVKAYDYLSSIGVISAVPGLETIKLSSEQIVELDATMIHKCDAFIVNFNFLKQDSDKRLGTGSLSELGMGLAWEKLIVGFIDGGVLPEHCKFVKGVCDYVCSSMEEALEKIKHTNEHYRNLGTGKLEN